MKANTNKGNKSQFQIKHDEATVRPYTEQVITHVLIEDGTGRWYAVEPGSFVFYKPADGAVPFINFDAMIHDETTGEPVRKRIEAFPGNIAAMAYDVPPSGKLTN